MTHLNYVNSSFILPVLITRKINYRLLWEVHFWKSKKSDISESSFLLSPISDCEKSRFESYWLSVRNTECAGDTGDVGMERVEKVEDVESVEKVGDMGDVRCMEDVWDIGEVGDGRAGNVGDVGGARFMEGAWDVWVGDIRDTGNMENIGYWEDVGVEDVVEDAEAFVVDPILLGRVCCLGLSDFLGVYL